MSITTTGDVVALTNSTGTVVAEYNYDAFGNPVSTGLKALSLTHTAMLGTGMTVRRGCTILMHGTMHQR